MQETILRDGEVAVILPNGTQIILNTKTIPMMIKDFMDSFKLDDIKGNETPETPKNEAKSKASIDPICQPLIDMYPWKFDHQIVKLPKKIWGNMRYADVLSRFPYFIISSEGVVFTSLKDAEDFYGLPKGSIYSAGNNFSGYVPAYMSVDYLGWDKWNKRERMMKGNDNIFDKIGVRRPFNMYSVGVNRANAANPIASMRNLKTVGFIVFDRGNFFNVASKLFNFNYILNEYFYGGSEDKDTNECRKKSVYRDMEQYWKKNSYGEITDVPERDRLKFYKGLVTLAQYAAEAKENKVNGKTCN